jgi:phospholipid/cholesterol/gamma-HCH transport system substrate-binding protein
METRASYVLVGIFMLAMLTATAGFVLWLGHYQSRVQFAYYDLFFSDSVAGLQQGSAVRYKGVEVGRVKDIDIDAANIERIRVRIEVRAGTPIHEGVFATLELQGITGLVFVQITGGSRASPMLPERTQEPFPVIPARQSRFALLLEGAPDLLTRATELLQQVQQMASPENRQALTQILANVRDLTGMLNGYSHRVDEMLAAGTVAANEAAGAARAYKDLAAHVDAKTGDVGDQAAAALAQMQEAARGFAKVSQQLNTVIADNRPGLRDFTGSGLYEFTQLMIEGRALVESITRVSQQFERDPARFLFGDRQKGFQIER